ncbi:MAG: lysozyme [Alphaproteobacteria bacterium]|nr:lysozyme [Alphaproteobacteria bacterium]
MKINHDGLELIKTFEGLRLQAYQDAVGVWTIGYGHTRTARPGKQITESDAEDLLRQDLDGFEDAVSRLVKVPLNENEFSALVSLTFNIGEGAFSKSTALKRLNAGDRKGAADAIEWWNKVRQGGQFVELRGLTRRRAAEKALFLKPIAPPVPEPEPQTGLAENTRVAPVEEPDRRGSLSSSRTMQGAGAAGVAGASGAVTAAAEQLKNVDTKNPIVRSFFDFLSQHQTEILVALGGLIVIAAIWIAWARFDDWRKGKR